MPPGIKGGLAMSKASFFPLLSYVPSPLFLLFLHFSPFSYKTSTMVHVFCTFLGACSLPASAKGQMQSTEETAGLSAPLGLNLKVPREFYISRAKGFIAELESLGTGGRVGGHVSFFTSLLWRHAGWKQSPGPLWLL